MIAPYSHGVDDHASPFRGVMELAIAEAQKATISGDLPIGALVLNSAGEVIAQAGNQREATQDPTAHAEILALRAAALVLGDWHLDGCTLVVTLEPCPMCAGAAVLARVDRIIFGAWNEEYGACGSHWDLPRDRRLNHRPEVVSGVMALECGNLVRDFMAGVRTQGGS